MIAHVSGETGIWQKIEFVASSKEYDLLIIRNKNIPFSISFGGVMYFLVNLFPFNKNKTAQLQVETCQTKVGPCWK